MAVYPDVGLLIDGIIALVALEAAALAGLRWFFGRGPSCAASIANCMAGAGLLLALRAAIADAPFAAIGACLFAALIAHVADLAMRWRVVRPTDLTRLHTHSSSNPLAPESSRV